MYIVSTILDPRYKPLINAVQMKSGQDELLRMLKSNGAQSDSQSSGQSSPVTVQEEGPSRKRQRFSYLSRVIEDKVRQGKQKASKQPLGRQELERYLESMPSSSDDDDDPLAFWVGQKELYPLLSTLAMDIMCVTGSSAPVERAFSTAGEATTGKRNRLASKNLEREILIRKNKLYLYSGSRY